MKHRCFAIVIVIAILLVGCKKEDLPEEIRDKIPFDELPSPIENSYFSVYMGPDTIKAGEGIYIGVDQLRGRRNIYVTFPNPNDKNNTVRLRLERYKNTNVWIMPPSWLHADGRVTYGTKPNENNVVEGERAIYTPFDWDEETIRIKVDDGKRDISFEANVIGNLKESIIVRPVDPRAPFPNGTSSVWEEHLSIFTELTDWWRKN